MQHLHHLYHHLYLHRYHHVWRRTRWSMLLSVVWVRASCWRCRNHFCQRTQVRVSFTYVFELYFEYFARSFRGFLGVKKSFETDDEVYKLVYHPLFRKYYKHTDGGWAGSLVPGKLEELRCHLSWVMTTDVGEWGVQEISDAVERLFTSQLKKQFRELQLFHPTHYVTAHMKHTPGIATMKLHWP